MAWGGRRRRGGINVTDIRRDGMDGLVVVPIAQDFGEVSGAGRDVVFALMQGITDTGSGRLATKARQVVYTITQQVENVT